MSDDDRNDAGQFAEGNESRLTHGIERSVKALASGRDLVGRAHDAQLAVHSEIETDGVIALLRRNVERTQAVTDLVWNEIQAAVQADDAERFDAWVRRHGWLVGVVNRAIQQLGDFEKNGDKGTSASAVLSAIKGNGDDGNK